MRKGVGWMVTFIAVCDEEGGNAWPVMLLVQRKGILSIKSIFDTLYHYPKNRKTH